MKKITLLVTAMLFIVSCNCQKKGVESTANVAKQSIMNAKVEYQANTRGFFEKITLQNKVVTVSSDRNSPEKGESTRISDKDWNELTTLFSTVKLNELATYKDPTQKRFYDGAAIADLKITVGDKEYQTTSFDDGIPPVEIQDFVKKVLSFSNRL